jgi:hypothetical protein
MLNTRQIHSLTDFLRNHKAYVARLKETKTPEILTVNGRAEIVIQDAESYQNLLDRLHHMETLTAIQEGIASAGSCTWPLRVNTSDSSVDRYRDKKVWTRGLSWHPSGPRPPGDALDAGRAGARRLLKPPFLAASHSCCLLTPPLAGATGAPDTGAPHAATRHDR